MIVLIESALQLVFSELLKIVVPEAKQSPGFQTLLKRLENTLKSIQPVIYENQKLIKVLDDRPQKETLLFISYLNRGKKLVLKTSRITFRNKYQKLLHSYKLIRLNNDIARFFHTELQVKIMAIEFNDLEQDNWHQLEELTLDVRSKNYSLPEFINRMGQLKVLRITGHCDHPSILHNLSSIACLDSNLTTIRFEHVSVSSLQPIFALRNLKQLTFVMCEIGDALMSFNSEPPYNTMLPNLRDFEISMCYDLKQLPSGICDLVNLQKLSITNCQELDVLPKELGGLSSLETLSLRSCTKLQELPESIGSLRNLSFIDMSDCLSVSLLPEAIGELRGLRVLKINGCTGLQELPMCTSELRQLEEVVCDEETAYLWMDFEGELQNLKINVVEEDRLGTLMKIMH